MRILLGLVLAVGLASAVTDSLNYRLVGRLAHPGPTSQYGFTDFALSGNLAYVPLKDTGIDVVSVADPHNPVVVGHLSTGSAIEAVDVAGDYAYAVGGGYLRVVDVSDSSVPTVVGTCAVTGYNLGVVVRGNYCYVANWENNFAVVNVSDPENPSVSGTCPAYGGRATALIGNTAYVTNAYSANTGQVYEIDVTTPASPTRGDSLAFYCTEGIDSIDGSHVLIADGTWVWAIDATSGLVKEDSFDNAGYAFCVDVVNDTAYIATDNYGLLVLDVSDPTDITQIGYWYTDSAGAQSVIYSDGFVYVCDYKDGLQILQSYVPGGDWFVSPDGAPTNPGTYAAPFASVQQAIDSAVAGDTVTVLAGTYSEALTFPRSGVADSAIIVRGDTNADGEPLAIVDGTSPVTSWTASARGSGIYQKAGLTAQVMLWNGDQITRISDTAMKGFTDGAWDIGFTILDYDTNANWSPYGVTMRFWPDVQMAYGVLGDTTFIRYVTRAWDPDTCDLRASEALSAGVVLDGNDYITIDGLQVRGYDSSIVVRNGSDHNIIQNCVLRNGCTRIQFNGGSAYNLFKNNDCAIGYGAWTETGEWDGPTINNHRLAMYGLGKWIEGASSSRDRGVQFALAGDSNIVEDNYIHDGSIGLHVWRTPTLVVRENLITRMSSIGVYTDERVANTYFYDNDVKHCNVLLRFAGLGMSGDAVRSGFWYNNRLYNDNQLGTCLKFFQDGYDSTVLGNIWFYHNSVAGGFDGGNPIYFCRNMKFVNNIFSTYYLAEGTNATDDADANIFAAYDYNFCGGLYRGYRYQSWMFRDRHNQWAADTMAGDVNHQVWALGAEPDSWTVVTGISTEAESSALDVFSDSFELRGVTYGKLPGRLTAYANMGVWNEPGIVAEEDTTPPVPPAASAVTIKGGSAASLMMMH